MEMTSTFFQFYNDLEPAFSEDDLLIALPIPKTNHDQP